MATFDTPVKELVGKSCTDPQWSPRLSRKLGDCVIMEHVKGKLLTLLLMLGYKDRNVLRKSCSQTLSFQKQNTTVNSN